MQTSTTRFSKTARTPEIIRCTAPKWRGYDGSKVNIIKLGKHWTCFNKIYSAQLTRSGSFRPWKRCHFLLTPDQIVNMKMASRNQRNFCRWNRSRAQCCAMIGHLHCQGEARVSCDGHFSLGKISLEKGLNSRKSTVKFFLWAAFMTLSKAIVACKLPLGPKRPTSIFIKLGFALGKQSYRYKIYI